VHRGNENIQKAMMRKTGRFVEMTDGRMKASGALECESNPAARRYRER
jgi:hypothetical protein